MRKFAMAGAGMIALFGIATAATAEETVVKSESRPGVAVEHREGVVEKSISSTDCGSKTVHKEDSAGNSKTVHKEGCN